MRNARKPEHILDLEKDDEVQENPFKEYFEPILDPQGQAERSREALGMNKTMVLSECMPELEQICRDEGLSLKKDWSEVMRIYNMQNLNK